MYRLSRKKAGVFTPRVKKDETSESWEYAELRLRWSVDLL